MQIHQTEFSLRKSAIAILKPHTERLKCEIIFFLNFHDYYVQRGKSKLFEVDM